MLDNQNTELFIDLNYPINNNKMGIIIYLIIAALTVAGGFLVSFFWATKDGQFDDTYTPSIRILFDDEKPVENHKKK
jgi:cbb3-type cytochrome oxidase maturation protein